MSEAYKNFIDDPEHNFNSTIPANYTTNQVNTTIVGEYDKFAIPPVIQFCEIHLAASAVGIEEAHSHNICHCCGDKTDKKPIGMCESTEQLSYLGPGYPLFFLYMKCCVVILTAMLIISGIYSIISNYNGGECFTDKYCADSYKTHLSFFNSKSNPHTVFIQQCLSLGVIITLIILLQIMRYEMRVVASECDERDVSASDFTLFVEGIPKNLDIDYQDELKHYFETLDTSQQIIVEKVNLAYDVRDLPKLEKKIDQAITKKEKAYEVFFKKGNFPVETPLNQIEEEINQAKNEIKAYTSKITQNKESFSGVAFISLHNESMKNFLLKNYEISGFNRFRLAFQDFCSSSSQKQMGLLFKNSRLFIKEAAEPGDVFWSNLGLTDRERYLRKLFGTGLALLLLIGCACLAYYFTIKKVIMSQHTEDDIKVKILTVMLSIGIVIINKGLSVIMPYIVKLEKNRSLSEENGSVVQKLSLVLFMNSGFIAFFVSSFFKTNDQAVFEKGAGSKFVDYGNEGGLISTLMSFFVSNTLMYAAMNFINPGYLMCLFSRWRNKKNNEKWALSQEKANKAFENPIFNIDTIAANMINVLLITSFFCQLIPLSLVFSLVLLILNYWIYKHAILRRSSIKNELGSNMSEQMTDMLDLCIFFYGTGTFLFNLLLTRPPNSITWLILIIGFVHFIIPTGSINEALFEVYTEDEKRNYEEASHEFDTDYEGKNPATFTFVREEKIKKSRAPVTVKNKGKN